MGMEHHVALISLATLLVRSMEKIAEKPDPKQ